MEKVNKNYWKEVKFLDKYFVSKVLQNRLKIHKFFENNIHTDSNTKILDIGTTPLLDEHENILLTRYNWKNNITCVSNQDCSNLKKKFPDITTVVGDAKKLNFLDSQFDVSYCSATIEHTGSLDNQVNCISDTFRVTKKHIFLTIQ